MAYAISTKILSAGPSHLAQVCLSSQANGTKSTSFLTRKGRSGLSTLGLRRWGMLREQSILKQRCTYLTYPILTYLFCMLKRHCRLWCRYRTLLLCRSEREQGSTWVWGIHINIQQNVLTKSANQLDCLIVDCVAVYKSSMAQVSQNHDMTENTSCVWVPTKHPINLATRSRTNLGPNTTLALLLQC